MIDINELRRLAQAAFAEPTSDNILDLHGALDAVEITKLLDRLEAAESACKEADKSCHDLTEKVIPNIREQLESAEKERDALRALGDILRSEISELRAKVEAMEKQEPVAFVLNAPKLKRCAALLDAGKKLPHKTKLYALPGAQPAPHIPDGWLERGLTELENIRNRFDDSTLMNDKTLIERLFIAMTTTPEDKP